MYESFYHFHQTPFRLTPDPHFFFGSTTHKRGLAYLQYAFMQREGFVVITGAPGTGKTELMLNLAESLPENDVTIAKVVSTNVDANGILQLIAASLQIFRDGMSKGALLKHIEEFLILQATQGKHVVLLIDEAHNLETACLSELSMLGNFQLNEQALVQCFLLGQESLENKLGELELEHLKQRIIASTHLEPLDAVETQQYIEYRLRRVGWQNDPRFPESVFPLIHDYSQGIPRQINKVCNRILLQAYLAEQHHVDETIIYQAINELHVDSGVANPYYQPKATIKQTLQPENTNLDKQNSEEDSLTNQREHIEYARVQNSDLLHDSFKDSTQPITAADNETVRLYNYNQSDPVHNPGPQSSTVINIADKLPSSANAFAATISNGKATIDDDVSATVDEVLGQNSIAEPDDNGRTADFLEKYNELRLGKTTAHARENIPIDKEIRAFATIYDRHDPFDYTTHHQSHDKFENHTPYEDYPTVITNANHGHLRHQNPSHNHNTKPGSVLNWKRSVLGGLLLGLCGYWGYQLFVEQQQVIISSLETLVSEELTTPASKPTLTQNLITPEAGTYTNSSPFKAEPGDGNLVIPQADTAILEAFHSKSGDSEFDGTLTVAEENIEQPPLKNNAEIKKTDTSPAKVVASAAVLSSIKKPEIKQSPPIKSGRKTNHKAGHENKPAKSSTLSAAAKPVLTADTAKVATPANKALVTATSKGQSKNSRNNITHSNESAPPMTSTGTQIALTESGFESASQLSTDKLIEAASQSIGNNPTSTVPVAAAIGAVQVPKPEKPQMELAVQTAPSKNEIDIKALNSLVSTIEDAYKDGDLMQLLSVFAKDVKSNEGNSRKHLEQEYGTLFTLTDTRSILFRNLKWSNKDNIMQGNGQFKLSVREKGSSRETSYTGNIRFAVEKKNDNLVITRLYYQYNY